MSRPTRKALFGYRPADANRYLDELESLIVERQQLRNRKLAEQRAQLEEAEQQVKHADAILKTLQADYFRLSGELSTLTIRAQEMITQARETFDTLEHQAWNRIDEHRQYGNHLQESIQLVPVQIRSVIESLTQPLLEGVPASNAKGSATTRDSETDLSEALTSEGGNHG